MTEAQIRTGCISWTYSDWLGSFYPEGTKTADYLTLYSRAFDIVEIDSSFYRIPKPSTVAQWKVKTPSNFLFTVKLPKKMTHEAKLKGISNSLEYFQKVIKPLGPRLACVIAQMPPSFKFDSGIEQLGEFLDSIDGSIRYAIEFRHDSWLKQETYDLLKAKKVCFVWSMNEYVDDLPSEVTTDFLYLRFMGEYSEFAKFDRLQKDKSDILESWWKNLEEKLGSIRQAFVLMSNHFAGFAPDALNQFRAAAGMEEIDWKAKMASSGNATLC
ncbi:MAG: DUF72 domain-containing protein [Nitrososphaerales archaeon]